jgi:hypothetical protein
MIAERFEQLHIPASKLEIVAGQVSNSSDPLAVVPNSPHR